jgi:hypothetical protein
VDLADLIGLSLTVLGFFVSIASYVKSEGAEKAVARMIVKTSDQIALETARNVLEKLKAARDAAMGRKRGASEISAFGRNIEDDKHKLALGQDALATVAFSANERLTARMRVAAKELTVAQEKISQNTKEDGWSMALTTLQGVIPELDLWQQELGSKTLR